MVYTLTYSLFLLQSSSHSVAGHFSCHFSLPLPQQIVIFTLGDWEPDNGSFNVDVSLDSDLPPCHIGTLSKENTSLCWEGAWSESFTEKSYEIYEQVELHGLTVYSIQ